MMKTMQKIMPVLVLLSVLAIPHSAFAQGTTVYSFKLPLAITMGGTGATTAAGAATNLGLGTADSPTFAGINILPDAGDTTERFTLGGRMLNFPVAYFTPTTNNTVISFDLCPKGSPSDYSAGVLGVAWFDLCSTDVLADGTNYECLRMQKFSNGVSSISSAKGGTGTLRDLVLQMSGGNVGIGTGTTAPTSLLTLNKSTMPAIEFQVSGTAKSYLAIATSSGNYFTGAATDDVIIRGMGGNILIGSNSTTPNPAIKVSPGASGNVQFSGNVGIGIAPSYPLHVSGNIYTTGNIGFLGTSPNSKYGLYAGKAYTDPVTNTAGIQLYLEPIYTEAETASESFWGFYGRVNPAVNTGHTNSGIVSPFFFSALRNYQAADTNDGGTLNILAGLYSQYGHNNLNASATPRSTTVAGIYLVPYSKTGTITNMYDIYLAADSTGGTVTNRYGIYQANTANNYFAGNIGIGVSPSWPLHVYWPTNSSNPQVFIDNQNTGTSARTTLALSNEGSTSGGAFRFMLTGTSYTASGGYVQDGAVIDAGESLNGGLSIMARYTSARIRFYTGGYADSNERFRITSSGNIGFNTTAFGASATKIISIGAGTAPSATITDGVQMWVEDMLGTAGAAGLHMMTEDSTDVQIIAGIIVKATTGDPTVVGPKFCINTYDNNVKVYADGGWRQLATW